MTGPVTEAVELVPPELEPAVEPLGAAEPLAAPTCAGDAVEPPCEEPPAETTIATTASATTAIRATAARRLRRTARRRSSRRSRRACMSSSLAPGGVIGLPGMAAKDSRCRRGRNHVIRLSLIFCYRAGRARDQTPARARARTRRARCRGRLRAQRAGPSRLRWAGAALHGARRGELLGQPRRAARGRAGERVGASSSTPPPIPTATSPLRPTPARSRGANMVIVNGVGYDDWAPQLLQASPAGGRVVLDVGRSLGLARGANPHRWYYPADVRAVIARDPRRLRPPGPARRRLFRRSRAAARNRLLRALRQRSARRSARAMRALPSATARASSRGSAKTCGCGC